MRRDFPISSENNGDGLGYGILASLGQTLASKCTGSKTARFYGAIWARILSQFIHDFEESEKETSDIVMASAEKFLLKCVNVALNDPENFEAPLLSIKSTGRHEIEERAQEKILKEAPFFEQDLRESRTLEQEEAYERFLNDADRMKWENGDSNSPGLLEFKAKHNDRQQLEHDTKPEFQNMQLHVRTPNPRTRKKPKNSSFGVRGIRKLRSKRKRRAMTAPIPSKINGPAVYNHQECFVCPVCSTSPRLMATKADVARHFRSAHPELPIPPTDEVRDIPLLDCSTGDTDSDVHNNDRL